MATVLITGSAGLIGSESVRFFCERGYKVVGIDNNMRRIFFGDDASTEWNRDCLLRDHGDRYAHYDLDIRDERGIRGIFEKYGQDIDLIIHAAAQPSHDWAANDPYTDFTVNANGTLTLLENTRQLCPEAVFIFCSTNKVYGDRPNFLPLIEQELRWEIDEGHAYYEGIDESMSIDYYLLYHTFFKQKQGRLTELRRNMMVNQPNLKVQLRIIDFHCHANSRSKPCRTSTLVE